MEPDIRNLRGLVATICLSGTVKPQYTAALMEMRSFNDRNDIHAVEYRVFNGVLVEEARDQVCLHALKEGYDYVLQIDADAAMFPPNSLARMLQTAFITDPNIDILGAYAQVKGGINLPTIDTGTGKWELIFPMQGILPVIRTGCHFLLTKCTALRTMKQPWFRTRRAIRPIDAIKDLDNFMRIHNNGQNPLYETPEWYAALNHAYEKTQPEPSAVGEDSSFCDKARALGLTIAVDTDLIVGHVSDKVITPQDLAEGWDMILDDFSLHLGIIR